MKALALVVVVVAHSLLVGVTPAAAIETTSFGIDIVDASKDRRLHIEVDAGTASAGRLRVWNKQDVPITVVLSVSPARVDGSGAASLGGDDEPVEWITVEPRTIVLPGRTDAIAQVKVDPPSRLDGETRTVAILAQVADGSAAPAVLERLAVTTFLEPGERSSATPLGAYPTLAMVALMIAAAGVVWRLRR